MRQEEHVNDALPKQSDRRVVNSSRHSFRPMVGLEQAWHSQVQEEEPGQEKNLNQSRYRQGEGLKRASDNQREVGVMKL